MLELVENSIIGFRKADETESMERILWLSNDRTEIVLINIDDAKKMGFPYFRS